MTMHLPTRHFLVQQLLTPNLLTPCDFCPVSEKEIEVQVTTFLEH
jgi:hypothetical protein